MHATGKSLKWYWMPLTILLIGMISISLFFAVHRISAYQHKNTILNNAILHMEVDAAIFHLRVDEIAAGEEGVEIKDAIAGMDRTIGRADAILKGKAIDSEEGSASGIVALLTLQKQVEELHSLLVEFKRLGMWRMEDVVAKGADAAADEQFDEQFDQILAKASVIEEVCTRNRNENRIKSQRVLRSIYFVWALIITAAAAGIWRMEMRRKSAEEALLESNSLSEE
jgi:hypothetical protein